MSDTIDSVNPYARKVNLVPEIQRPQALTEVEWFHGFGRGPKSTLCPPADTFVRSLPVSLHRDVLYQRVRPVTARSRLAAKTVEVIYVRVTKFRGHGALIACWERRYDRDETHPGKDKWRRLPNIYVGKNQGMVYWTSAGTAKSVNEELKKLGAK